MSGISFYLVLKTEPDRAAATITAIHSSSWVVGASPLLALLLIVSGRHLFSASVSLSVAASLLCTVSRHRCRHCFSLPSSPLKDLLGAVDVTVSVVVVLEPSLLLFLSELNFFPPCRHVPSSLVAGKRATSIYDVADFLK
ncbi:hypothetical protein AHAS_Ahas15G0340700 [Arachis hypogaea]